MRLAEHNQPFGLQLVIHDLHTPVDFIVIRDHVDLKILYRPLLCTNLKGRYASSLFHILMSHQLISLFSDLVKSFLDRYDLDWDLDLQESPQQLVGSWFSCRQVHADYQPELGNLYCTVF